MGYIFISIVAIVLFSIVVVLWRKSSQRAFLNNYPFPPSLKDKVRARYPHLVDSELDLVMDGLRDYFRVCQHAGKRMVAMPSQAVDVAWHEFILFTRQYQQFCRRSLGRFLHHTPTEAMASPTVAQTGIKRAWRLACAAEKIDPKAPTRLPLLFAIDGILNIPDGFNYSLNCLDPNSPAYGNGYCAGHIGCTTGCGGDSGSHSDAGDGFGGDSSCGGD